MLLSFPPRRALAIAIIGAAFTSHAAFAEAPVVQVRTAYNSDLQVPLHYAEPVRLAQVLADSLAQLPKLPVAADTANATTGSTSGTVATTVSNNAIYWTNSALYSAGSDPAVVVQQQAVIEQLAALLNTLDDTQERDAVKALSAWTASLPTAKRVLTDLDWDNTRLSPQHNPLITRSMVLVLPARPDHVTVTGAVFDSANKAGNHASKMAITLPWLAGQTARNYLAHVTPFNDADNSVAMVIQPNGDVASHPIAYWNATHKDIAPGTIIVLPFTDLPDEADSLNQDLIHLLRNSAL